MRFKYLSPATIKEIWHVITFFQVTLHVTRSKGLHCSTWSLHLYTHHTTLDAYWPGHLDQYVFELAFQTEHRILNCQYTYSWWYMPYPLPSGWGLGLKVSGASTSSVASTVGSVRSTRSTTTKVKRCFLHLHFSPRSVQSSWVLRVWYVFSRAAFVLPTDIPQQLWRKFRWYGHSRRRPRS